VISLSVGLLPTWGTAFGFDLPVHPHDVLPTMPHAASVWIASTATAAGPASILGSLNPVSLYMNTLTAHPLPTKMATGAVLAVAGDAIAQAHEPQPHEYDRRRAGSFAAFDMAYRALQHATYPSIVNHCHGQYIGTVVSLLFSQYYLPLDFGAAVERTLSSQLGIVPFIYYPVFFALTAYIQGLDVEGGVNRAKNMFLPLMQRNLLFWIPVQMIQFSFVPEDLQIPFVSVMGLFWTFVLSVMAGSTKKAVQEQDETYCVIGTEEGCVLPEDLFPDASLQDISAELTHEAQVITDVLSHEFEEITHNIFDRDDQDNVNGVDKKEVETEKEREEEREEVFK